MKKSNARHEVLLFTRTTFCTRQFCEGNHTSPMDLPGDQLEKACWSRLLVDILPGILANQSGKRTNYTWEVIPAQHFIDVKIAPTPYSIHYVTSINPYFFLGGKNFN